MIHKIMDIYNNNCYHIYVYHITLSGQNLDGNCQCVLFCISFFTLRLLTNPFPTDILFLEIDQWLQSGYWVKLWKPRGILPL